MKLSDFSNKKHVPKQASTQFVLENEALDFKYSKQINELESKLEHYINIDAERDDALRKLNVSIEKLRTTEFENSNLLTELEQLKQTLIDQEKRLNSIPVFEEETRNAKGVLSDKQNDLDNALKRITEQSSTLSQMNQRVEALDSDNELLATRNKQNTADVISANEERKQVLEKNKKLETFADETSKINIEVRKQNKTLRDESLFWENESKDLTTQLEEAVFIETNLRKWVTNLEKEDATNKTIKGGLTKDMSSIKNTVLEMNVVIEGLVKENNYLRGVNREFRKQLLKPRYMSMGSIARKEGFKMPQGKENIRTKYLGNASPTLLKFKAKEENSDAR